MADDSGVDVVDIGLVGTEEVYFAVFSLGLDGGVMVTASHNPRDYNGMKFTRDKARPISADTGLLEIMETAAMELLELAGQRSSGAHRGSGATIRADPSHRSTTVRATSSTCSPTSIVAKLTAPEE